MRQTEREKWWTSLAYVGADGLALYAWLSWVAADIAGIAHATPDTAQIAMKWPHRTRAAKALTALSAPEVGAPLVVWSPEAGVVYIRNWNQLNAKIAPQQASHVKSRLADISALPDCEARRVAEAELTPWRKEFDVAVAPEMYVVEQFRARMPKAARPDRDALAPGSDLRTVLASAWARESKTEWWDRYLEVVAQLTAQGAKPLRVDAETVAQLKLPNAAVPVTLPLLLQHHVARFIRSKKETVHGPAQAA